jgi:hypothetical protein
LLLTLCWFLRGINNIIVVVVMEIATARLEVQQLRQGEPAVLVTYTVVPDYFKNQIELTLWS